MLLTLKQILSIASKNQMAFPSFNCPNLESAVAVAEAAEKLKTPFILSHGPAHDCFTPIEIVSPIYHCLAERSLTDVCLHLDHCDDIAYIEKALKLGFTSVMYDGSHLSYEENVENTIKVVALAKQYGASVEAELGQVANSSFGLIEKAQECDTIYTDPKQARDFVERTGIDALAIAVGTVHGVYIKEPRLRLDLIKQIHDEVQIPLVLHGGSGLADEAIKTAIQNGVRKINYYTYMSMAGGEAVKEYCRQNDVVFFHDVANVGIKAMCEDAQRAMLKMMLHKGKDNEQ